MEYCEFIRKFNSKEIKRVNFRLKGYPHYDDCAIFYRRDDVGGGRSVEIIVCRLTRDDYQTVSFYRQFDEEYKLFDMGRKGKFTLKQAWPLVGIIAVG